MIPEQAAQAGLGPSSGASCHRSRAPRRCKAPRSSPVVTVGGGGSETVSAWNINMANNKVAGDIDTNWQACAHGVDCSGFVQQIWGIVDAKHNVTQLATTYSNPVAVGNLIAYDACALPGSHIVTWHRWLNGGLDISEATTSDSLDRTVERWVDDSHVNGYTPIRYINAC